MHVLLTGGSGQVGQSLRGLDWPEGVTIHAPAREELDLSDENSIARILQGQPWGAIINSGAYTAVDAAETDVVTAWKVNALAPAILATFAHRRQIPIVHLSTDYVFSGENDRPWVETDPVGPLNVYGASKQAGEQAVRTSATRHLVVRTSWVLSPHGKNFAKTILRHAQEKPFLRIVSDQRARPTIAVSLARVVRQLTLAMISGDPRVCGTVHAANKGEASWADLASAILEVAARLGHPQVPIEAIATKGYPTLARRPLYSTLSTEKLESELGIFMSHWHDELPALVASLLSHAERG